MVEILRNKNLATRFQILVEIAGSGPNIQQRDIAARLAITPQAVSNYVRQLLSDGLLASEGRSKYRVTSEGVNWIIKVLRELRSYHADVEKSVTNISVCAAVAEGDLKAGQTVGLRMKRGLLFATVRAGKGAKGTAISDAARGEDVAVTGIDGIVDFATGGVTILKVPVVEKGGSHAIDSGRLKGAISEGRLAGAIGIEAIIALKKAGVGFAYTYGVAEAAIEAANSGLSSIIVCVDAEVSNLTRRLTEEKIAYEIVDLTMVRCK